jgi:hypothetical protein
MAAVSQLGPVEMNETDQNGLVSALTEGAQILISILVFFFQSLVTHLVVLLLMDGTIQDDVQHDQHDQQAHGAENIFPVIIQ